MSSKFDLITTSMTKRKLRLLEFIFWVDDTCMKNLVHKVE